MEQAVQSLIAKRVKHGTTELIKLIDDLGPERMVVKPMGKCRSALDQAAECALIMFYCTQTINDQGYKGEFDFSAFQKTKDDLASDWPTLKETLIKNSDDFAAATISVPDEKMSETLNLPWGELSYEDVMVYPYWNLTYHAGQVTYLGFLTE